MPGDDVAIVKPGTRCVGCGFAKRGFGCGFPPKGGFRCGCHSWNSRSAFESFESSLNGAFRSSELLLLWRRGALSATAAPVSDRGLFFSL